MSTFAPYKAAFRDIGPIISRHVFLLVNGIIVAVVALLFIFGDTEAALFIGAITVFNMLLGIVQDTRARISLEALQMLTALRVIRVKADGGTESILIEDVEKGDHIDLQLGYQVPCDGVLLSSASLEVSEALVTGEASSFPRGQGDRVNAGDIVTAGRAMLEAESAFRDSRISQMAKDAKRYSANPSPIERATQTVIKYAGVITLLVIAFVTIRGLIVHEPPVDIVLNIGALASMLIPQGLLVITTFLFAFGAASYSKKQVLFQEINATEKLGRIKNLCMDKTGTLTNNILSVEKMHVREGISEPEARGLSLLYVRYSGDVSETLVAVGESLRSVPGDLKEGPAPKVLNALSFSSWRQYGAVTVDRDGTIQTIVIGSPDVLLDHVAEDKGKAWLAKLIEDHSHSGKRILCVGTCDSRDVSKGLEGVHISVVAAFIFESGFRQGVESAIKFFQDRGVRIRIISGDNVDTVQSIALAAGVDHTEAVVTGADMQSWSDADFDHKARACTIFARIVPEQKVRIIESLKKDGFTAMVGDGANDALAIKKADLGIAMFDGVPATRRLAGVILMKNSFSDLPGAVELADNFIGNITILSAAFINSSLVGLIFFVMISIFGYAYPITPLNVTLTNYFVVGIPAVLTGYWSLRPAGRILPATSEGFLARVLPFVVWSAVLQAAAIAIVFALGPDSLKVASSNMLVLIAVIISGFIFFALASGVYRGALARSEKLHIAGAALFGLALFYVIIHIPLAVRFFNLTLPLPDSADITRTLVVLLICGVLQYVLMRIFLRKRR